METGKTHLCALHCIVIMSLWVVSLVIQFYQLGFLMEFLNSLALLAFFEEKLVQIKSIDLIKLSYK
jgi:hypothetical protein